MKAGLLSTLVCCVLALACGGGARGRAEEGGRPALFVARDADSTLYLYGTIHLRRAGQAWGAPAVEAALAESDEIWTELEISPEADARVRRLAMEAGMAPAGRPLSSWLSADERRRLGETARRYGLRPEALEPFQPWLAGLTLTMAPVIEAGYDPAAGVDRAVDAFGDAHGKTMRAFETPEQQIGFFAALAPEVQRAMLLEAIDEAEAGVAALNDLSAAWERGDTGALERLLNEEMRAEYPAVYEALIRQRNDEMTRAIMAELAGAGVDFVAVGAAHIVGPDGIVAQLRARGVRVERALEQFAKSVARFSAENRAKYGSRPAPAAQAAR